MIHIVVGEVVAANGVAGHRTHQAFHHPLGRVPKQESGRATGAISANRSEFSQLLQVWDRRAVGSDVETHPRNEDAVEETLQDRGKPLGPNRIDQHESFRSEQTIGIVTDGRAVQLDVIIVHPLLLTHDRIEAFGIEVTIVDLMSARTQSRDDLPMQRRSEARGDWIRVQNKNAQRRAPFVCDGWKRLSLRATAAVARKDFPAGP
jgi:hypothetical protein